MSTYTEINKKSYQKHREKRIQEAKFYREKRKEEIKKIEEENKKLKAMLEKLVG